MVMVLLQTVMYIGAAIFILMFMITVHELGHYVAGKILGLKINEFAIGFGKPIYKRTSKKTGEVFSIRWLPIGGYCAFAGDEAAAAEGSARTDAAEREKQGMPTPKGVDFNKAHPWKRIVVLFAGGFFNFLSAIIFAIVLFMIVGYYQAVGITSVTAKNAMGEDNPNAALLANVKAIHGIGTNDDNIQTFTLLRSFDSIKNKYNDETVLVFRVEYKPGTLEYEQYGKMANVHGITFDTFIAIDSKGDVIKDEATGEPKTYVGIGFGPRLIWQPLGFFEAIGYATKFCFEIAWVILVFLGQLVTGQMGFFGNVAGPTATVSVMGEMLNISMLNILILVPLISVNLALFNLLPVPALDGARMVFVGIEWARGKPINPEIENRINLFGLLFLFGLVIVADIGFWIIKGSSRIFLLISKLLL